VGVECLSGTLSVPLLLGVPMLDWLTLQGVVSIYPSPEEELADLRTIFSPFSVFIALC